MIAIAPRLPWPVWIAGDAKDPSLGEQDGGAAGLPAGTIMLGRLPTAQLAGWLARTSIYVLPARYEPFGLSILEAALCGCALVLGDIPSLREIWADAAVYVDPDDRQRLAAELERLIRDSRVRNEMSRRAQLRAQDFSPQRMVREYLTACRLCGLSCSVTP